MGTAQSHHQLQVKELFEFQPAHSSLKLILRFRKMHLIQRSPPAQQTELFQQLFGEILLHSQRKVVEHLRDQAAKSAAVQPRFRQLCGAGVKRNDGARVQLADVAFIRKPVVFRMRHL